MRAIIPAAGRGTRFLPVTRVVPKEMLPIGSRPALELIVCEAKEAGADEIVLIISHEKEMIREYFKDDPSIRFVYQEEQKGLGHAVLQAAGDATEGQVLILLGDALVAGCNAAREMVALSRENGNCGVLGCEYVPREKVSRYGIIRPDDMRIAPTVPSGACVAVADLVEKPSVEEAPSNLAIAGRYLLPAAIFDLLRTQTPGKGGEIQLTDAIRRLPKGTLLAYAYPGRRQDIGNPRGYFEALQAMGMNQ